MASLNYSYQLLKSLKDISQDDIYLQRFLAKVAFLKLDYFSQNRRSQQIIETSVDLLINADVFNSFEDLIIYTLNNYRDEWHDAFLIILSSIDSDIDDDVKKTILRIVDNRNFENIELQKTLIAAYLGKDHYLNHTIHLRGLLNQNEFTTECIRLINQHEQNFIVINTVFDCFYSHLRSHHNRHYPQKEMYDFIQNYRYRNNEQLSRIINQIVDLINRQTFD